MNKFRFIFTNGDVVTKKSNYGLDQVVLQVYVARLNAKKPATFCNVFAFDERANQFLPVNKPMVTISLKCN